MEVANFRSLAELGIDHGFGHQTWQSPPMMSSLDDHDLNALSSSSSASMALMGEHYHHPHHHMHPSNNSNNYEEMLFISQLKQYSLQDLSHHDHILHRPAKQQKINTTSTTTTDHHHHHHHHNISSNPQQTVDIFNIPSPNNGYHVANSASAARCSMKRPKEEEMINFPQNHDIMVSHGSSSVCNQNYVFNPTTTATLEANKRSTAAATNARLTQAQDHIMAERKRREKLSQRFIQLSALVPGLKKMDKASVLGDAIKYLKHLQEEVKNLEEQINRKRTMESVVYVKKYELCAHDDNYSSSNENISGAGAGAGEHMINEPLPEIEARLSEKNVLIRIHCEKRKGILDKTLAEIEKLEHLSVTNSSVMSFGSSVLDMTIIAEMEEDFSMSMKDLVKKLRDALLKFL